MGWGMPADERNPRRMRPLCLPTQLLPAHKVQGMSCLPLDSMQAYGLRALLNSFLHGSA